LALPSKITVSGEQIGEQGFCDDLLTRMLKRFTVARFANQGIIEHFFNDRFLTIYR